MTERLDDGFIDRFFAPLGLPRFLAEYWDERPALIPGEPARVRSLIAGGLDDERLRATLERAHAVGALRTEDATSIRIPDLHLFDEGLLRFYGEIRRGLELVATCGTMVFRHPPSGKGVPIHLDHGAVFHLLVSGTKRWRVSARPHARWPRSSLYAGSDGRIVSSDDGWQSEVVSPDDIDLVELEMRAGDILYLPAGTWHTTESTPGGSLGISFYAYPVRFEEVLAVALRDAFGSRPEWRAPFPPPAKVAATTAFAAARLADLRRLLERLEPDGPELLRARKKIAARRPPDLAPYLRPTLSSHATVTADDDVRLPYDAPVTFVEVTEPDGSPSIHAWYGDEELRFDEPRLLPYARRLLLANRFRAGDSIAWSAGRKPYSFVRDVAPLLEALLRRGIVHKVSG